MMDTTTAIQQGVEALEDLVADRLEDRLQSLAAQAWAADDLARAAVELPSGTDAAAFYVGRAMAFRQSIKMMRPILVALRNHGPR